MKKNNIKTLKVFCAFIFAFFLQINLTFSQSHWIAGGNGAGGGDPVTTNNQLGTTTGNNVALDIQTDGTTRVHVNGTGSSQDGFVGIGITVPTNLLHQHATDSINHYHQFTNGKTGSASTDGLIMGLTLNTSLHTMEADINQQENAAMNFFTTNTQRIVVKAGTAGSATAGYVGIGNGFQSPASRLHINQNSTGGTAANNDVWLQLTTNATSNSSGDGFRIGVINSSSNVEIKQQEPADMLFYTTPSGTALERMRIVTGGNVGIGTASPGAHLEVKSDGTASGSLSAIYANASGNNLSTDIYAITANAQDVNGGPCRAIIANSTSGSGTIEGLKETITGNFSNTSGSSMDLTGINSTVTKNSSTTGNTNGNTTGIQSIVTSYHPDAFLYGINNSVSNTNHANLTYGIDNNVSNTAVTGGYTECGHFNILNYGTSTGGTHYAGLFEINNYATITGGNYYGVYSSVSSSLGATVDEAGHFEGDVTVNGVFTINSDSIFKINVVPLTNALTTLKALHPKQYNFDTNKYWYLNLPGGIHYGLIAQQVASVKPELVGHSVHPEKIDKNGVVLSPELDYKVLNYIELIPIIIEAMKEQQNQIDSLLAIVNPIQPIQNNNPTNQKGIGTSQLEVTLSNSQVVYLSQNNPNPFFDNTTISFSIPDDVKSASIMFSDNNGSIIKTVEINSRGKNSLMVYGENLSKGIYSYTLIVDGKIADSKRMVKQ